MKKMYPTLTMAGQTPPEGLKNFKSHVLQRTALWRQRGELVSVLKGMSGSVKYRRPIKSDLTSSIWNDSVISKLKKTQEIRIFKKSSAQPASLPREHQRSKVSFGGLTACFILSYGQSPTALQVTHGAPRASQDSVSQLLPAPAPPQHTERGLLSGQVLQVIPHLLLFRQFRQLMHSEGSACGTVVYIPPPCSRRD